MIQRMFFKNTGTSFQIGKFYNSPPKLLQIAKRDLFDILSRFELTTDGERNGSQCKNRKDDFTESDTDGFGDFRIRSRIQGLSRP